MDLVANGKLSLAQTCICSIRMICEKSIITAVAVPICSGSFAAASACPHCGNRHFWLATGFQVCDFCRLWLAAG